MLVKHRSAEILRSILSLQAVPVGQKMVLKARRTDDESEDGIREGFCFEAPKAAGPSLNLGGIVSRPSSLGACSARGRYSSLPQAVCVHWRPGWDSRLEGVRF